MFQFFFGVNPPRYPSLNFQIVPENFVKVLMKSTTKLRLVFVVGTPVAGHFAKLYGNYILRWTSPSFLYFRFNAPAIVGSFTDFPRCNPAQFFNE